MSSQEFVATPKFEEYRDVFKDFYKLERRDDGVLLVRAHTEDGSIRLNVQNHRSLGQLLKVIGADPENEVLILTGSGADFMMASDPGGFALAFVAVTRGRDVLRSHRLRRGRENRDDLGLPPEGDPADFACAFLAVRDHGRSAKALMPK